MHKFNHASYKSSIHIHMKSFIFLILSVFVISCSSTSANHNADSGESAAQEEIEDYIISDLVTEDPKDIPEEAESPRIDITVTGLNPGKAYMIGTYTDQRYRADTAEIDQGGKMRFENKNPYREGLYYVVFEDNTFLQMLVDKDQRFTMRTTTAEPVMDMQVEGDLENQLLYENLKFQEAQKRESNRLKSEMKELDKSSREYKDLKAKLDAQNNDRRAHLETLFRKYPNQFWTKFKKAGQNPELRDIKGPDGKVDKVAQVVQFRKEFWDGVDFTDTRLLATPVIANKLKRYIKELTPQNPDSMIVAIDDLMVRLDKSNTEDPYYGYFVNWIGLEYEPGKTTLMDAEAVYVHMVKNYYTYDRAYWADSAQVHALQLRAYEMGNSLVGQKGPNVESRNPQGQTKSIYEINKPYVVVYLYNPQCEHCAVETPKLVKFEKDNRNEFGVYAIAIDTDDAEWKGYLNKNGMQNFTNVHDPTNKSIYATYYVNVTPELYVLNPDRIIIGKNLKVNQIMTVVNRDKEKRAAG